MPSFPPKWIHLAILPIFRKILLARLARTSLNFLTSQKQKLFFKNFKAETSRISYTSASEERRIEHDFSCIVRKPESHVGGYLLNQSKIRVKYAKKLKHSGFSSSPSDAAGLASTLSRCVSTFEELDTFYHKK